MCSSARLGALLVARPELFDAAVNKAKTYALRLGVPLDNAEKLRGGLELWYLKTRFAYRVPFEAVLACLQRCPAKEAAQGAIWQGGETGRWVLTANNP